MTLLSSLRGRIFLTSALLAVLSIGVAIYLVNVRVTREEERALLREIVTTAPPALVNTSFRNRPAGSLTIRRSSQSTTSPDKSRDPRASQARSPPIRRT